MGVQMSTFRHRGTGGISAQGGSRPSEGGVEENPLKSCLSVSRVESGTPAGGWTSIVERGDFGLRSGFEPPDLDRPGRLPHQQGLCEVRLG